MAMIRTVLMLITVCVTQAASAQSTNQNYIVTKTLRVSGVTSDAALRTAATDKNKVQTAVEYYDGLGRPIQSIQKAASPLGYDIVQPRVYDSYGREGRKYLPYVPTTGTLGYFRSSTSGAQQAFYNAPPAGVVAIPNATEIAYADTKFEASPLNRPIEQGAPGLNWKIGGAHTALMSYGVNLTSDAVKLWQVNASGGASYSTTYAEGTLTKTKALDENHNAVIELKDGEGHVVSRKIQNGVGVYLTTDYIYDDLGNLRYVIPPLPSASGSNPAVSVPTSFTESDDTFLNFFYAYHYDGLNRQTEKKIPGKGWQYMVYNNMDQIILSQDANQKLSNIWMVTKYDALGRVVITGKYFSTTATRSILQTTADTYTTNLYESFTNASTFYGYTHVSWPDISTGTNNKVLTVTYYDNYEVIGNTSVNPGSSVFTGPDPLIDTLEKAPNGLPVATLTNVLGTTTYLFSVAYYDLDGKQVKAISQHYQGGTTAYTKYDTQESTYSFQGLSSKNTRKHYLPVSSSPQITINNWSTYDHLNRPLLNKQQFNSPTSIGPVTTLSKIDYNEIGQASVKHLHSTDVAAYPASSTFLQHINYSYNSRGWLTKINDPSNLIDPVFTSTFDVFAEQLDYDRAANGYANTAQYNGNISAVRWQTKNPSSMAITQEVKGYIFSYDPLNRLTGGASKASISGDGLYDETLSYDELGNILSLTRKKAGGNLNNMLYNYTDASARSSRLKGIADNGTVTESQATSYNYNTNGSLTSDTKKMITAIVYNELNLPSAITITSANKTLNYVYDATGVKLERIIKLNGNISEERSYDNGIEYAGNSVEFIHTPEGRVLPSTGTYSYEYNLTDHLGNVRGVFGDKNNDGILTTAEILQITDNYAFGREINYAQNLIPSPDNRYKYNGKEYQDDIAEYDYGARFYDAVIGRWNVIDPLAEKYILYNGYSYAINNPVSFIDPEGTDVIQVDGGYKYTEEDAISAFNLIKNKTANVYLAVSRDKDLRNDFNSNKNESRDGQWSVFGVTSLQQGLNILNNIASVANFSLNNLVVETHGGVNLKGVPDIKLNDNDDYDSAASSFLANNELDVANGHIPGANLVNNPDIAPKVAVLQGLANKLTDGGNLIFASCNTGVGDSGKAFGQNLNEATGKRINIFLAKVNIQPRYYEDNGVRGVRFSYMFQGSFLQTQPNGTQINVKRISLSATMNTPPVTIHK